MPNAVGMTIEAREHYLLATLQSEAVSGDNMSAVCAALCESAQQHAPRPVLLDLSHIALLPSTSLGDLLQIKKALAAQQQRLALVGLRPDVRRVFALTKLDKLFEMRDSLDDALAHLARRP